jgi:hypothetical protein
MNTPVWNDSEAMLSIDSQNPFERVAGKVLVEKVSKRNR